VLQREYYQGTTRSVKSLMGVSANTWYEVALRLNSTGGFQVVVWKRGDAAVWGADSMQFASGWEGLSWTYVAQAYNGTLQVHYYAGGRRIALRSAGTLLWLTGDHLGSATVTADANGGNVQRQLYKGWGETRSTTSVATEYAYTGQYAYDSANELGLLFYRARWYDPLLGRFISADSIVPGAFDPLAYDRYTYVRSNPLRYIDPSGHKYCDGRSINDCTRYSYSIEHTAIMYKIRFDGWTSKNQAVALEAVERVGARLAEIRGKGESSSDAFKAVYGYVKLEWEESAGDCQGIPADAGGCTDNAHKIRFWSLSGQMYDDTPRMVKNVIHELGHAFDNSLGYKDSVGKSRRPDQDMSAGFTRDTVLLPNPLADKRWNWQQSSQTTSNEVFADMFIAFTYDAWNNDPMNAAIASDARSWIRDLVALP
ncbi:MAG: RHS repeat-associated core domain-containing protein, partial [Anaerolineales bacterium]|nr:RHS repeat-associated core domain-containing protein [Anaerolineales bacterium]